MALSPGDRDLPQIRFVCTLVQRGIGIHHGGLLPIIKEMVSETSLSPTSSSTLSSIIGHFVPRLVYPRPYNRFVPCSLVRVFFSIPAQARISSTVLCMYIQSRRQGDTTKVGECLRLSLAHLCTPCSCSIACEGVGVELLGISRSKEIVCLVLQIRHLFFCISRQIYAARYYQIFSFSICRYICVYTHASSCIFIRVSPFTVTRSLLRVPECMNEESSFHNSFFSARRWKFCSREAQFVSYLLQRLQRQD